ncbi:MAG: DNA-binding response regulator [Bacteroidales bacterium]
MSNQPLSRPKILFVDDEQPVLDGLRRAFHDASADWDMVFEADPLRARELALATAFQVIVTDLRMPGLGGLELLAQLREAGCQSSCLVLTGTGDMNSALEAINRGGVFRFFTKPCAPAVLRQGIADALARQEQRAGGAQLALAALDRLPFAALALDGRFRPVFTNRAGGLLLAAAEVLRLDGGGICRAHVPAETAALHQAVQATAGDGESRVLGLTGRDESRYSALVEPATDAGGPADGALALVFVREIDTCPLPTPEALRDLFSLSMSEARLAHALASGLDIKEAAELQGVTLSTARTYLKRLFQKTGANRQAELVRLLLNAVAGL